MSPTYGGKLTPRYFAPKAKAPCKKCQKRYVGCHGECKEYSDWKNGWLDERKKQSDALKNEKMVDDVLAKAAIKYNKSRGINAKGG